MRARRVLTPLVFLLGAATPAAHGQSPAASLHAPAWERRLLAWPAHAGEPRPWRSDPRLAGRFHPEFPDDIQVVVMRPDTTAKPPAEVIWVRMIAQDSASGRFLAYSLNEPHAIPGFHAGDNLVFRWDDATRWPKGVDDGSGYGRTGWPAASLAKPFFPALLEGLRHYRMGDNGRNMPEIEACIRTLRPVEASLPAEATADERFLAHFVLGRCLAEKYETEEAVAVFRRAIAVAPDSADAHMALLAELSVMVSKPVKDIRSGTAEDWERQFAAQYEVVRARFAGADPLIPRLLAAMKDEGEAGDLSKLAPEELARRRRTSFITIRWKQR